MLGNTANLLYTNADGHSSLVDAGTTIEKQIQCDRKYPDLADVLLGKSQPNTHTDHSPRHTLEEYVKRPTAIEQDFYKKETIDIPQSLVDSLDLLQCRTFMGIFPEISCAWMTVDNRLFLWNYTTGTVACTYDDQDQVICSVGLIKPKPDIFGDTISHLLVFSTPLYIGILAVSLNKPENSISLYATDLVVPSDGMQITQITGTDDGRIFLLGDGRVYELEYSMPSFSWFRNHCRLIPHYHSSIRDYLPTFFKGPKGDEIKSLEIDNERKVLYLLSNQSRIEVVYLGDKENNYKSIAVKNDICNSARLACRQKLLAFDDAEFKIDAIHVISKTESKKIHLVGITSSGYRLYFTHHRNAVQMMSFTQADQPPNGLELVHVRIPPPIETPSATTLFQTQPKNGPIHTSYYDCGIMLAAKMTSDDNDTIVMTAVDPGSYARQGSTAANTNTNTLFSAGTNALSSTPRVTLAESSTSIDCYGRVYAIAEANASLRGKHDINEITTQITQQPRQFLVLTGKGVTFFAKKRPVDILQELLRNAHGDVESHSKEFANFFERYGRVQSCAMCLDIVCANFGASLPEQADVIRGAVQLFFGCGGSPAPVAAASSGGNYLGQLIGSTGTHYSGKHDGFALYFAELISPVWNAKVFEACNPGFHANANIADPRFHLEDQGMLQVVMNEQQSLHGLYLLLKQSIEAISFLDFLIDSKLKDILQCVPETFRSEMQTLSLGAMLKDPQGRVMTRELVIASIRKYGHSHIHIGFDVVSDLLERKCNSFFGPSDVSFYRGVENMSRAKRADTDQERISALGESLRLFKQAPEYLTDEKLGEICSDFNNLGYYIGSVELPLERVRKLDSEGRAFAFTEGESSIGDAGQQLHEARRRCYEHVFRALKAVKTYVDTRYGDPKTYAARVYAAAYSYDDKHFQYDLYSWLIQENMQRELLQVNTPYLLPFFQERVEEGKAMDFLWQYHRLREEYLEAAVYLEALASRPNGLPLVKRLEYLSLAIVNARCCETWRYSHQEITRSLRFLEDQMAVAQIQWSIQCKLQSGGPEYHEAAKALDGGLFDLTVLHDKYARPYGLDEEIKDIEALNE
ncbi:Nup133 N terminal like-domain-containing protein [Dichotomocladium elegans]|nr:Nup133 N terminal like-domain-containing protein [Dichotomocladium elegans]